jgi:lipopolysaccharide/colanic/teichoic acid biosynthesis glycosyltransferase
MTRFGDIALALALLFICLPVIVLASCAVWLDLAAVPLRRVERVTGDGRIVRLWRFAITKESRYGPKLTASGALLRRWHLDQIPQLLNVVAGDLSLLSSRPDAIASRKGFAWRER